MDQLFLPLLLVVMVGSMFWLSSRNRKQQQAASAFRDNLQPGQEVMTGSGMYGTVVSVDDDVITLETSPGVTTRWFKPAIAKLVETPVADDAADEEYDEDSEWDEQEWEDEDWDEAGEDAEDLDEDAQGLDEDAEGLDEGPEDTSGPEDDRRA